MDFLFLSSEEITQITDQHQLALSWQRVQRGRDVGDAVSKPSHVRQLAYRGSHWTKARVAKLRYCPKGQRASLAAHVAADGTVGRHMKECSSEPPPSRC